MLIFTLASPQYKDILVTNQICALVLVNRSLQVISVSFENGIAGMASSALLVDVNDNDTIKHHSSQ